MNPLNAQDNMYNNTNDYTKYIQLHESILNDSYNKTGIDYTTILHDKYATCSTLTSHNPTRKASPNSSSNRYSEKYWQKHVKLLQKSNGHNQHIVHAKNSLEHNKKNNCISIIDSYSNTQDSCRPKRNVKHFKYFADPSASMSIVQILRQQDTPILDTLVANSQPSSSYQRFKGNSFASATRLDSQRISTSLSSDCTTSVKINNNFGVFSKAKRFPVIISKYNNKKSSFSNEHEQHSQDYGERNADSGESIKGTFSYASRFNSEQIHGPSCTTYAIQRLFDNASIREERFAQLLAQVKANDATELLRKSRMIARSYIAKPNALHIAANTNDCKTIYKIIHDNSFDNNININDKVRDSGQSALHIATIKNHIEAVLTLLGKPLLGEIRLGKMTQGGVRAIEGVDVNVQDNSGDTALHIASRMGLLDIVGILCDAGADLNLKNHHGRVPLDESRTQRIYQEIMLTITANKLRSELSCMKQSTRGTSIDECISSSGDVGISADAEHFHSGSLHSYYLGYEG